MKKVYQIWDETSVGPTFDTEDQAFEYLLELYDDETEEEVRQQMKSGYPEIREITLGDKTQDWWDR